MVYGGFLYQYVDVFVGIYSACCRYRTVGIVDVRTEIRSDFCCKLFVSRVDSVGWIYCICQSFLGQRRVITFFGITTVFYGVTDLINQYNVNKLRKQRQEEEQRQKMGGGEIEDADYEEIKEDN